MARIGAKLLASAVAAVWLSACGTRAPTACAAAADPAFAAIDDAAARAAIADALLRGDLDCAGLLVSARHAVLLGRDQRAATIARLDLRDLALSSLGETQLSAADRLSLVTVATTPSGASNSTATDSRADSKLLKLAAVQMLSEQAYGEWLDAFAAWLRVSPRSDFDARPLLPGHPNDEPFVALWQSGNSERVLALMRQVASEPNLAELHKSLGRALVRTDECRDGRDAPSAAMVAQCREHLRLLSDIETLGCCEAYPGGMSEMTFEAATVMLRSGAITEGSVAVEQAVAMLNTLPPKDRWPALERVAAQLQRVDYSRARVTALRQEAETLRRLQYQPSSPAAQ